MLPNLLIHLTSECWSLYRRELAGLWTAAFAILQQCSIGCNTLHLRRNLPARTGFCSRRRRQGCPRVQQVRTLLAPNDGGGRRKWATDQSTKRLSREVLVAASLPCSRGSSLASCSLLVPISQCTPLGFGPLWGGPCRDKCYCSRRSTARSTALSAATSSLGSRQIDRWSTHLSAV